MCVFSHWVISDSLWPHRVWSTRILCPWGISQSRILAWVAISYSRGSSHPRDRTQDSCTAGRFFTTEPHLETLKCAVSLLKLSSGTDYWFTYWKAGLWVWVHVIPTVNMETGVAATSQLLLCLLSCYYLTNGSIHKTSHHLEHSWPTAILQNNKLFLWM